MCLAIPMRVIEIKGDSDDLLNPQIATVETDGVRKEIRLDLVDRLPEIGDYLIIHAGFAVNCLDAENAEINLRLLRELAEGMDESTDGNRI
ncbi:HypC/HybG/HupF family hydrogenase formation chaperone [Desulfotalea psychrophila]|uniref:HypC/HybG/HupF family hydrogenase formation chaperone n=1 Tax=Desulfotalea psychrophila TaxID=84980 RepID=A0ABS3ASG5_9BACT|nr:HypC/HybG/HupF family hydrogenase formation chaperone [Desulfocapsa sp.]MBN4065234.1 HypC/HybG/HupF family hydrogenase formation chaperone [Desulfocapsa sp. AH-315-G09]MBN4068049.1 HypC/HybG/HupF family hydrogenase formation chaperone [Desulfotalea psychrophila]MBN4071653.1 HypC/HybG/HupF family hydrogenase formation chaperone [Desulfotalea psychrophila]